jgi:hypothetical protein
LSIKVINAISDVLVYRIGDLQPMYLNDSYKFRSQNDVYRTMNYVERNITEIVDYITKQEEKQ